MKFNSRPIIFSICALLITSCLLLSSAQNLLMILMYVLAAYVAVESIRPMYYIVRMVQAGTVKNAFPCVVPAIALVLCIFVFFYPMWPNAWKSPVTIDNTPFTLIGLAALVDVFVGLYIYIMMNRTNRKLANQSSVETPEKIETTNEED